MIQLKLIVQPGNPIINTWLSSDAHYAFCEFRTIEECNAALNLNGISVGPTQLRIGRPKNYTGPQPTVGMGIGALGMVRLLNSPLDIIDHHRPFHLSCSWMPRLIVACSVCSVWCDRAWVGWVWAWLG
jgi:hypothetical protein